MNSTALSTIILNVLSTVTHYHQYPDAARLINRLSATFHFDHHIYFVDASAADISNWLQLSSFHATLVNFIPQSVYTFDSARNVNTTKMSKNPFLIVVAEHFANDSQLFAQVKIIRKIDVSVKYGVFFTRSITSLDIVEQLFRWSCRVGIFDIFCAFYLNGKDGESSFNVFKYDPFGTFELVNVTRCESFRDYFPDKVPNHRKNGFFEYPPDVRSAYDDGIWDFVLPAFNASRSMSKNVAGMGYHGAVLNNISPNFIYPVRYVNLVVLVPHAQPETNWVAYLQNGTWTLLFILAFVVIATSSVLLAVSRYLQQKKILLFQCLADVVNLLMNDNATIRYGNLHWADVYVIVPLTFTGLIVMNGIVSLFQSYLTSPIYRRQINSLHDLYVSSVPLTVDVGDYSMIVETLEYITNCGGWSSKVRQAVNVQYDAHAFNNSLAFPVDIINAEIFLELQKRLGLKAYHMLSGTFLNRQFVSYTVSPVFPFTDHLNNIIHRLNAAGLIDKHLDKIHKNLVEQLWQLNRKRHSHIDIELSLGEFTVPAVVWCGWIASGTVFICELIWNKIESLNFNLSKRVLRSRVNHAVRVLQNWNFK